MENKANESIRIEPVTEKQVIELQDVGKQTFSETFAAINTQENMDKYLIESFSIDKLSAELNNKHSQFYFAKLDNKIIGYLKLNTGDAQSELTAIDALEIERIYVLNAFHGKGVGQLLYEQALKIAGDLNASFVWLGVWEENLRAIRFYQKNGFVPFDKHIFKLGNDEQTDLLMKKTMHDETY